jgi:hypothetical protein
VHVPVDSHPIASLVEWSAWLQAHANGGEFDMDRFWVPPHLPLPAVLPNTPDQMRLELCGTISISYLSILSLATIDILCLYVYVITIYLHKQVPHCIMPFVSPPLRPSINCYVVVMTSIVVMVLVVPPWVVY